LRIIGAPPGFEASTKPFVFLVILPGMYGLPRSIYEDARDVARALSKTKAFEQSCRDRKRVEMLFAHLKRILRLGRLRLRGPRGAQDEFVLAAIAQNLRRLAKLVTDPPPLVAPHAAPAQIGTKDAQGRAEIKSTSTLA